MNRNHRSRTVCLAAAILLSTAGAACGSDDAASDQLPQPATPTVGDPSDEPGNDPAETPASEGTVIGTANMNGTVVDPQPHTIDEVAILESYPESLVITFTGGDASCTAADARAVADGDTVRIELQVGITEDALTRSCLAGEFTHSLSIQLTEGLDGRTVATD